MTTRIQNRPMGTAVCQECGEEFTRRTDSINRHKHNYCSPACANKANGKKSRGRILPTMRNGKEIECAWCHKKFYVSGSRLKNGARFCSPHCHAKWTAINEPEHLTKLIKSVDNSGEKNGRYKHGQRVGGHTQKKELRAQVINRDGDWCLICGKPPKGLHLHRVIYGSQGGKYILENCVQLCSEHHAVVHSNKRIWQPFLLEYLKRTDGYPDFAAREWAVKMAEQLAKEG